MYRTTVKPPEPVTEEAVEALARDLYQNIMQPERVYLEGSFPDKLLWMNLPNNHVDRVHCRSAARAVLDRQTKGGVK